MPYGGEPRQNTLPLWTLHSMQSSWTQKESVFEEVRHLPEVGVATLNFLYARAPHFTVMMKPY